MFHAVLACLQELGYDPRGLASLDLAVAAELTGAWTVTAPADPRGGEALLAATAGLHMYGPAFLQARMRAASLRNAFIPYPTLPYLSPSCLKPRAAARRRGSSGARASR